MGNDDLIERELFARTAAEFFMEYARALRDARELREHNLELADKCGKMAMSLEPIPATHASAIPATHASAMHVQADAQAAAIRRIETMFAMFEPLMRQTVARETRRKRKPAR